MGRKILVVLGSPSVAHTVQVPCALGFQTFPLLEQDNKCPASVFLPTSCSSALPFPIPYPRGGERGIPSYVLAGRQHSRAVLVLLAAFLPFSEEQTELFSSVLLQSLALESWIISLKKRLAV